MDKKVYIGIAGKILSGKGTAAEFFVKRFSAEHLRFSMVLDEILEVMNLEKTRLNEQDLGATVKVLFGEEVLSHALVQRAKNSEKKIIVFEGLRKKEEAETFRRELPGFKLIYLKASPEIRYARMQKRNEKVGESTKSYEEFLASEQHEADKSIGELENVADFVIVNESAPLDLEDQLTKILTLNV